MSMEKMLNGKENKPDVLCLKWSELLYLCFWGLMLFAKGIGLYDGQSLYKVFLIAAFLCIIGKMCITEYSGREWAVILFLLVLSTAVYRVSGEKGVLICMVTVAAMKNVSVKRAFAVGLFVWSVAMGGRFMVSLAGIDGVQTAVQTKNISGAVLRYFMGYPHPNVLHISYLILTAFVIFCVKETYNWKHLLVLTAGNLFLFFYSYSFTGALTVMAYLLLSYYVRKKRINRIEYFLVSLVFPACILFSVIFPMVLSGEAFELADRIFNNRIHLAKHFLTLENMSLLGNNLAAITTDVITMDNAYIFALVTYGIPIFLLICAGYLIVIWDYIKQKKNIELAMICCFLLAGITEPFLFNTSFKNLTLLFIGEGLFIMLRGKAERKRTFALLKNRDKEILIPIGKLQKAKERFLDIWSARRKVILGAGIVAACAIALLAGVFYQPGQAVLQVQKENLLVYERIRVITTAFSLGFLVSVMAICAGYAIGLKNVQKTENKK